MLIRGVTFNGIYYPVGTSCNKLPKDKIVTLEKAGNLKEVKPLKAVKETK